MSLIDSRAELATSGAAERLNPHSPVQSAESADFLISIRARIRAKEAAVIRQDLAALVHCPAVLCCGSESANYSKTTERISFSN